MNTNELGYHVATQMRKLSHGDRSYTVDPTPSPTKLPPGSRTYEVSGYSTFTRLHYFDTWQDAQDFIDRCRNKGYHKSPAKAY